MVGRTAFLEASISCVSEGALRMQLGRVGDTNTLNETSGPRGLSYQTAVSSSSEGLIHIYIHSIPTLVCVSLTLVQGWDW